MYIMRKSNAKIEKRQAAIVVIGSVRSLLYINTWGVKAAEPYGSSFCGPAEKGKLWILIIGKVLREIRVGGWVCMTQWHERSNEQR